MVVCGQEEVVVSTKICLLLPIVELAAIENYMKKSKVYKKNPLESTGL